MSTRFDCIHATTCGGCPLIHLAYDGQLAEKVARVRACVSRYPALRALRVHDVLGAEPQTGYRTRAKVMVAPGGRVGLFGVEGDHEVVDTPGCIVLAPVLANVLGVLRAWVVDAERTGHLSPLAPRRGAGGGGLVAIDVREVTGGVSGESPRALVTWVVARDAATRLESLRAAANELMATVPAVLGVAVNFQEDERPQVLGEETLLLAGKRSVMDTVGGNAHLATFGSFVQAHRGQAARVHAMVADAVFEGARARPPRVLDLYGGSGAIAMALAARGADVSMVESFGPAVLAARESARALGVSIVAECADVGVALARLARHPGALDAVVVNPPRRGLEPAVRVRLARLEVGTLVYVSCHPETLARDMDHLARLGLVAADLRPVDMIPLTAEVETVVILRRGPPPAPRVVYEDDEVVVVDKPAHEPTTPQGEHTGSLLARVAAVHRGVFPVHRLDVGTSGLVIFAKAAIHVAPWAAALAADGARKTYTAAVRGLPDERGMVDAPLVISGTSKSARTHFVRVRALGSHALISVVPEEGRTHQIRRHLASIGHPVLGDARYGHAATNRFFAEKHGLDRTFLHAAELRLRHPTSGRQVSLEAPLPGDLENVVRSVEGVAALRSRVP